MSEEKKKVKMKVDNGGMGNEYIDVEYPSNRREKNIKQITNKATVKKPTLANKIVNTFVGEDVEDASSYIVHDVVIPAVKNMFFDGLETLFFGRPRAGRKGTSRVTRPPTSGHVPYSSLFNAREIEPPRQVQSRAAHLFNDIVIANRPDAEAVIMLLVDSIEEYGSASVADLYAAVGITSQYTDHNYGWVNLSTASVRRDRHGYLLNLPRPEALN